MRFSLCAALPALAAAAPFTFPLQNGFPAPSPDAIKQINAAAGGSLSDGPPPPANISSPAAITNFQLIAFNEIFEVAFFTQLISNITNNVPGYSFDQNPDLKKYANLEKTALLNILTRIQAQEELHALNANNVLKAFKQPPIEACKYQFPVSNLQDAIQFAATFTDLVLGTLQDAEQIFAADPKNSAFVRAVASVIGQEGEQEGFYDLVRGKFPSSSPFLTTSAADFAFTAINANVVPGSCPNSNLIKLNIFKPLNVLDKTITQQTKTINLSWPKGEKPSSIVYISGAGNIPVVVPFTVNNATSTPSTVVVSAPFPFDINMGFAEGLQIAAATRTSGPFANADAVAKDTIFGPGVFLVESNILG